MCLSCTIEEITGFDLSTDEGHEELEKLGRIPWPDATDEMLEAANLIAAMYVRLAPTGGPLHVVTDDWNVEDSNIAFARDEIPRRTDIDDFPRLSFIANWILDLLTPMSVIERSVTISLAHNDLAAIHGKVYMPATEFPIREHITDDAGNVIGYQWGFRHRRVEGGT